MSASCLVDDDILSIAVTDWRVSSVDRIEKGVEIEQCGVVETS